MKLVYISGPYHSMNAWIQEKNICEAERLGLVVANIGLVPVIPHTMYRFFDDIRPAEYWLKTSFALALKCDAMIMLPRWQESKGSVAERKAFNGPVFDDKVDLAEWAAQVSE